MRGKKITNENLATMVQRGFEHVDEKFGALTNDMNSRFDAVENRFDAIETELLDIKEKIKNIVYRHEFEILKDRVTQLEKRLVAARKK